MTCLKKYFSTCIILFIILNRIELKAQSTSIDGAFAKAFATDELLPILIDAAIKNSGEIRKYDKNIQFAEANYKINKNAIYSGLALISSYSYGTNYAAVADATVSNSFNRLTTTQTGFYNIGAGLQLPLTSIINRKHIIKAGRMQVEMLMGEKDNSTLMVKQEVIRMYQELKLSQKLLAISTSSKQALQINYDLAEKEFLQGQLTVEQISRVLEINNKAKMEYENSLNLFQTNILQLETFTGINLVSLLKKAK